MEVSRLKKTRAILYSEYKNSDFFKPFNGGLLSYEMIVLVNSYVITCILC